jgi:hypothetical protein
MNKLVQGLIAVSAIILNLGMIGGLLYKSWFEPDIKALMSTVLLIWFVSNIALAWVAFGPEAKD